MDFRDSPDEADFRAALRRWLETNIPDPPGDSEAERVAQAIAWHHTLAAGGWLGLSWPVDAGGRDLPPSYEAIFNEELGHAGAPPAPHVGFLGRAVLLFGTAEQRSRWLPGLLSGDEQWCQGFSEPGAGSDLGALSTRGALADGQWVINGQKVWTSDAQHADWCLLLVRTEADQPKHRGISCLVVDMHQPGVTVRPLRQITGDREFNEVFFDDATAPAEHLIGRRGGGWELAMTTLGYERGPADIGFISRYYRALGELEERASASDDQQLRIRVARARVHLEALRVQVLRSLSRRLDGSTPGPEGSIDKLLMVRAEQNLHHVVMDSLGAEVLVGGRHGRQLGEYLFSRSQSIAGGSQEIQLSIIAERLLGLPRSR